VGWWGYLPIAGNMKVYCSITARFRLYDSGRKYRELEVDLGYDQFYGCWATASFLLTEDNVDGPFDCANLSQVNVPPGSPSIACNNTAGTCVVSA
jgi:hypothetical protein